MYNAPLYQQNMYHAADNHPLNQQLLDMIARGLLGGPAVNMSAQQRQILQTIITALNPLLSQMMGMPDASYGWATLYRGLATNPAIVNVGGDGGGSYTSFNRAHVHAAAARQLAIELQQQIYANGGSTNPYNGLSEQTVMGMAADYAKRNPVVMYQEQMESSGAALNAQIDKLVRDGKLKAGSREEQAYRRQAIAMETLQIAAIQAKVRKTEKKVISLQEAEALRKSNEKYKGDVFSTLEATDKQAVRMGVREVSAFKNRGLKEGDVAISDSEFASAELALSGRGNLSGVYASYTTAMEKAMEQQSKVVAELSEVFGTKDYLQITHNARALHMRSLSTEQGLKEAKERIRQSVAIASVTNRSLADILQEQADIGQQLGRHASGESIMMIQRRAAVFTGIDERAGGQGIFNLAEMTAQSIQARTNNQNNAMGYSFGRYMLDNLYMDGSTVAAVKALLKRMENPTSRNDYQTANRALLALATKLGVDTQDEAMKQYVVGHHPADRISAGKAAVYLKDVLNTEFELRANSIGGDAETDILANKGAYVEHAVELYKLYGPDVVRLQKAIKAAGGNKSAEELKSEGFIDSEISMIEKLKKSGLSMGQLHNLIETTKTHSAVIANAHQLLEHENNVNRQEREAAENNAGSLKFWDRLAGRKFDIISGSQAFLKGALGMEELNGDEAMSANLQILRDLIDEDFSKYPKYGLASSIKGVIVKQAQKAFDAKLESDPGFEAAVEKKMAERGSKKGDDDYYDNLAKVKDEVKREIVKARGYDEDLLDIWGNNLIGDWILTAKKNAHGDYEYSNEFINEVIKRSGTKYTAAQLRKDPAAMQAAMNDMQDTVITEYDGHLVLMPKRLNDLLTERNILNHEKFKKMPAELANKLVTNTRGQIVGFVDGGGTHVKLDGKTTSFKVGEGERYEVKIDKAGNYLGYEDTKIKTKFDNDEQSARKKIEDSDKLNAAEKMAALSSDETAKNTANVYQILADIVAGTSAVAVKVVNA